MADLPHDLPPEPGPDLRGRTALVTGASAGIGFESAKALAIAGASVALCARGRQALAAAAASIRAAAGDEPVTVAADLSTADGAEDAARGAARALGHVDILVNVAGAAPAGDILALTDGDWAAALDLKLLGYVRLMRALLPGMVERGFGRIVNVAGNSGVQPEGWLVSASVANAAVIALTRCGSTPPSAQESTRAIALSPSASARSRVVTTHRMGIGPVPASARALDRAGLTLADMDLIELNEAFAAQVLAVARAWKLGEGDFARLNVNGSGISLGHPVGATGARILATLVHELERRDAHYGLETMCIGGGQGLAAVIERLA